MSQHVVIIGGGLAGLSAGCYARASGFQTTIIEHNLALGGVCQAWTRGPYTVDGCIHWLSGGPFDRLYEELGIFPKVKRHTLDELATYRDVRDGLEITVTRDLDALARTLERIAPEDTAEIQRLVDAARAVGHLDPHVERPPELATFRDAVGELWGMRQDLRTFAHFRTSVGDWSRDHLKSVRLRRFVTRLLPEEAPALFLLFMLGYLSRGHLSRPDGGTARFRDALIESYRGLGGAERLHTTVDEILVTNGRATGVRLADGTIVDADLIISTASGPETVLRLLGGRFDADEMRSRLESWKLFDPIILASYGVSNALEGVPSTLLLEGIEPIAIGPRNTTHLYLRIYNDDPSFAPPGHTVVQAMVATDYDWWAKRGSGYSAAKDAISELVLERIIDHIPQMKRAVQMTDIATPLTYWNMARSWRGAYEGWLPSPDSFFGHVKKTLQNLEHLYMAGQWVEPGGGVPSALMSGRQVVQIMCAEHDRTFAAPTR